tara:strand:- start:154 stop:465 length:312 start_codon:yes stop_codon:yes gene_type:complete
MTTETTENEQPSPSMIFANKIINLANDHLKEGQGVENIAQGIRHAAANFSAYAFFLTTQDSKDPNDVVEDFVRFFEYYLSAHAPQQEASSGLADTIAQAKDEL